MPIPHPSSQLSPAVPTARSWLVAAALVVVSSFFPLTASAQESAVETEKTTPDVHFVPTPIEAVKAMLEVTHVGKDDVVFDLGSGDGRLVIQAAKLHGARGVGIDIDPVRIGEANHNADSVGVTNRVRFIQGDLFKADIHEATVVTLYLLPRLNRELRPKLFAELQPGTEIASNSFDMGAWQPDSTFDVPRSDGGSVTVHYWVLPADAGGTWALTVGEGERARRYDLTLEQSYQMLGGTATLEGRKLQVQDGRLKGDEIRFTLPDGSGARALRLTGRVGGDAMQGTLTGGEAKTWSAKRVKPAARKPYEVPDTT